MAARVLIQGGVRSVMKVSLPGFDVTTAPLSGLAFDAQFANLEVLARGQFQMPSHGIPIPFDTVTVFFTPQTQAPLCFCYLGGSAGGGGLTPYRVRNNNQSSPTHTFFEAVVSTDRVVFGFWASNGQRGSYVILKQL